MVGDPIPLEVAAPLGIYADGTKLPGALAPGFEGLQKLAGRGLGIELGNHHCSIANLDIGGCCFLVQGDFL